MKTQAKLDGCAIRLKNAERRYSSPSGDYFALQAVSFELDAGELVAVVGGSGSGKSTLLNLVTGIDRPTAGEIWVQGMALRTASEDELCRFRARQVGIVFQFFQLLPTLTAIENVKLAMQFGGVVDVAEREGRALALLDSVGVGDQAHKFPDALSGGQQQRVAVARALANDPPLIVADEPTGNLDSRTAHEVLMLFADLAGRGKTVLIVTHEREHRALFGRVLELSDGRLVRTTLDQPAEVGACI